MEAELLAALKSRTGQDFAEQEVLEVPKARRGVTAVMLGIRTGRVMCSVWLPCNGCVRCVSGGAGGWGQHWVPGRQAGGGEHDKATASMSRCQGQNMLPGAQSGACCASAECS